MAEGYGTNVGADTYHAARGNAAWASKTSDQKTAARLRGSEWLDNRYAARFPGYKVERRDQEREWPRYDAFDVDGNPIDYDEIPIEVEYASYEAALREAVKPGSLDPDLFRGGMIKKVKAGSVEVEWGGAAAAGTTYSSIDAILYPVLTNIGSSGSAYSAPAIRA